MEKADACVESLLKNLSALVKGSRIDLVGGKLPQGETTAPKHIKSDDLLEVVAGQISSDSQQLYQIISDFQSKTVLGEFEKVNAKTLERQEELDKAGAEISADVHALRQQLQSLLHDLEAHYYQTACPVEPSKQS
mmetsp:Transcript_7901/g.20233  ORF Transcript_7901/g.20233 Transcript_7901/m.20233 type:complete len:135 (-) Transcript_7901:726-1130(-)